MSRWWTPVSRDHLEQDFCNEEMEFGICHLVFGIWVELVVFGRSSQVGVSVRDVDGT